MSLPVAIDLDADAGEGMDDRQLLPDVTSVDVCGLAEAKRKMKG